MIRKFSTLRTSTKLLLTTCVTMCFCLLMWAVKAHDDPRAVTDGGYLSETPLTIGYAYATSQMRGEPGGYFYGHVIRESYVSVNGCLWIKALTSGDCAHDYKLKAYYIISPNDYYVLSESPPALTGTLRTWRVRVSLGNGLYAWEGRYSPHVQIVMYRERKDNGVFLDQHFARAYMHVAITNSNRPNEARSKTAVSTHLPVLAPGRD